MECDQQGDAREEDEERDEEVAVGDDALGGLQKAHAAGVRQDGRYIAGNKVFTGTLRTIADDYPSGVRQSGGYDAVRYTRPSIEDVEFGHRLRDSGRRILLVKSAQGSHLKRWLPVGVFRTDLFDRAIPWTELILSALGKRIF